jgi:hypothetical protein
LQTEAELLELLRALQQLEFTVDAIRVTEIGTAVKPLRKHGSKQIRQLVRSLIDGWKAVVNDWVNNGGAIVGEEWKFDEHLLVLNSSVLFRCDLNTIFLNKNKNHRSYSTVDGRFLLGAGRRRVAFPSHG